MPYRIDPDNSSCVQVQKAGKWKPLTCLPSPKKAAAYLIALGIHAHRTSSSRFALEVSDPFNLPMSGAEKYWESKVAVSPAEYKVMSAAAKVQAFAAAEIAKSEELYTVQRAIQRAISQGTTLEDFKKDAAEVFARRGWDTDNPYRIDLIFRNNVQTAYAVGQWQEINTGNLFPYVEYSSINDNRRTPLCKRLDGMVWQRDDPALDTVAPLNHHQ